VLKNARFFFELNIFTGVNTDRYLISLSSNISILRYLDAVIERIQVSKKQSNVYRINKMQNIKLGDKQMVTRGYYLTAVTLMGVLASAGSSVSAQTKEALYVKSVAATCATCHGTNGKSVEGSAVVSLAGVSKDHIVTQMKAFKSGARPATVMHQLSKGYSDEQIEHIAGYFASQK
jgi:cytochrome subunit of sulfide dehydrogenase